MTQFKIVAFIVILSVCGFRVGYAAEQPKATDKELVLEYQLNESRIKDFAGAIRELQARQQTLGKEIQKRPSIVGTGGVKAPKKGKK